MTIESGFFNRMLKLQAIRMLGSGMDLGELDGYSYEICFLLIQNVFKREISENPNRTRNDMVFITEKILRDMGLEGNREIIERIVDGTLWYRNPNRQDSFSTLVYNESTRAKEEYNFRYFKVDRENSRWEQGGSTVYMLTEESQEMIFITREILEEFGFDLEQFYTMQLIKTGNFSKAKNSIENLIARVRVLINREKEYRQDILRNPQNIFIDKTIHGKKNESEIKEQFKNEQEVFDKMFTWRNRYSLLPKDKKQEAEGMFDDLERARNLHDNLARMVMENLALALEIRVKYPESFWNISRFNFRRDIWQNNIVKNGLSKMEDLEKILYPLFSPRLEFIYPLSWAWAEQVVTKKMEKSKDIDKVSLEDWKFRETDWEILLDLYEDIFLSLKDKGEFSILELNSIGEIKKEKWLSQRENIDFFMMLVISETYLDIDSTGEDERRRLFSLLCERNPSLKSLNGNTILSKLEKTDKRFQWKELFISPYIIYLKEWKDELYQ